MFKIVLVSALLGLAAAATIDQTAEILSYENNPADAEGNFAYSYAATNGISAQESGYIAGVSGSAQYTSPEGIPIQLQYTADQDGFHPSGSHLPTPPPPEPVPEYIIRSIDYINSHPQQEDRQNSQSPFRG